MQEEAIREYEKIAQENQQTLKEIQENKQPPIISEKARKNIVKTVRAVLGGGMVAGVTFPLVGCKEAPAVIEEQPGEKGQETISGEVATVEGVKKETSPVEEKKVKESNIPEIPGFTFNQETRKYSNEAGVEVGILVENALEINGQTQSAIGLKPEIIKDIIAKNKEEGIFQLPWFFNPQENKGIKIVELVSLSGGYKYLGIKYSEPINVYAPSDSVYGYKFKYIPQENDSFSSQDFSGTYFSTGFETKNKDGKIVSVDYEIEGVDLEPSIDLSQPWLSGRWEIQHFLDDIELGHFVGQLLPTNPNYSFLDFRNRADWYENPDHCQASLWLNIFSDNQGVKSDLDKILKFGEGNSKTTVFIWNESQKIAYK